MCSMINTQDGVDNSQALISSTQCLRSDQLIIKCLRSDNELIFQCLRSANQLYEIIYVLYKYSKLPNTVELIHRDTETHQVHTDT